MCYSRYLHNCYPPLLIEIRFFRFVHLVFHVPCCSVYNIKYNLKKANYSQLYHLLSEIDWWRLYSVPDVDAVVGGFYNILFATFDQCVPIITPSYKRK